MKILQINTTVNSGSTGKITEQIGAKVLENDYMSHIAYSRAGNKSASNTYQIGNKFDIYRHVIETRLLDNHGFASTKATKSLVEYIKNENPDIVHLHNVHGYFINIEVLFNFLSVSNKPIVWTLHDCWAFTGHCSYFDRVDCTKWKVQCQKCPLTKYYPASWFYDNSKNNYNRKKELFNKPKNLFIITPSHWLKNHVDQSFLRAHKIKVIHNGIDLQLFKPVKSNVLEKYGISNNKVILGVASIWDSRKGLDDFLSLSKQLDNDFKILLVGLNKKLIKSLPENIIGVERTENISELARLYASTDIYVNPTYSDNFPTTNIEALACGTPVITYRTGGSPEAIDANTGLVVEKGDIKQLAIAIKEIIQGTHRFRSDQCRSRAETLFNKDDRFDDYVELYKKVLSRNENKG